MHKNYNTILFDVDDTLIDFSAVEKNSLKKVFEESNILLTDEISNEYRKINKQLWHAYENGQMGLSEILVERFSKTFKLFGISENPSMFNNRFLELLGEDTVAVNGALEVLSYAKRKNCKVYAITNGISEVQKKRLKNTGLYELFDGIFCSGDVGYQKPSKEYYSYVFSNIDEFDAERTLIVGDSPATDLSGGIKFGIDTCWFNPRGEQCEVYHKWEISKLSELFEII